MRREKKRNRQDGIKHLSPRIGPRRPRGQQTSTLPDICKEDGMLKKVCVGFDGSDNAYRAFDFAIDLCRMCPSAGLEVHVISVAMPPEVPNVDYDAIMSTIVEHYEGLLNDLEKKAHKSNVEIKTMTTIGHPADQILRYVKDNRCDMIIVGQRGKSGVEVFLLGSVSRRIARHAPCTVVIVK
jgi:nucleotide-binding universal stress UspA family protein